MLHTATEGRRFSSLDFLKFLLATVIVFHHFQQSTETRFEHLNFFYGRIYFGYVVEFFFIISGFVTAFQLGRKKLGSFRSWMLHKMGRILPMAALSVVAYLAVYLMSTALGIPSMPGLWAIVTSMTCIFDGGGYVCPALV